MQMFEMDAYVGVDVLGLIFMKGEQPHAGFPEVKYADMAESLARAGYRVVVVEQVGVCVLAVNTQGARVLGCAQYANMAEGLARAGCHVVKRVGRLVREVP